MVNDIFRHLKVLELASVLAGPSVGMFFAELGARVVKIEHRSSGGDVTRRWKTPDEAPENTSSAYYASVNWGKEVLMMDLDRPADYKRFLTELKDTDVLISNLKPSSARRMMLDPDSIHSKKEGLIYANLISYPHDKERPAFDVVLQAEAGYMSMTGTPDGPPVRMPVAMIDVLAAHQLKEAILVALLERGSTGQGTTVQVSLYESAITGLVNQASNYLMNGKVPQPMGSAHPNIAPYGDTFQCKDGLRVVLAVGSDRQFAELCEVFGLTDISSDRDFNSNAARVRNRPHLTTVLQREFDLWEGEPLVSELKKNGIPFGIIRDLADVFTDKIASHMILEEPDLDGKLTRRVSSVAFTLEEP